MTDDTPTTEVKTDEDVEPHCFNVQIADVTAAAMGVRATRISDLDKVVLSVGPLYVSFRSRSEAREFFARGVELVDALPAEAVLA